MIGSERHHQFRSGFAVVRTVLGLLVLIAGALKGYDLLVGSAHEGSSFLPRWALAAAAELEIGLGLWMLSGRYLPHSWLAALTFFSAMAVVSLLQAVWGRASCGCFGRMAVAPWQVFGLDVLATLALLRWRPTPPPPRILWHLRSYMCYCVYQRLAT